MSGVEEHCYEVGLRIYHTKGHVAPWIMIQSCS